MSKASVAIANERDQFRAVLQKLRLPRFGGKSAGAKVVALEGPNGAGKTTLGQALAKALSIPFCLGTDEAWVSSPFKTRMIRDADWHASAMFFFSGCFERMRLLRQGRDRLVVMDRSLWSTLAVHAAESADRLAALLSMLAPVATEVHVPDLTIVLEASFAACQKRIARKRAAARALDRLTASALFHAREQEFYHWLARHTATVAFLDATRDSRQTVASNAIALIRERLPC